MCPNLKLYVPKAQPLNVYTDLKKNSFKLNFSRAKCKQTLSFSWRETNSY